MFTTFKEASHYIEENSIQMIDLKFCDLCGRWRHITITRDSFVPSLIQEGVGFDGSAIGLRSVECGDLVLIPDLSSAFKDPFWDEPTISFICGIYEADSKAVHQNDPRNISRRAEKYLVESNIADRSRWGPEFEFYVFDNVTYENSMSRSGYRIESGKAVRSSGTAGHGHNPPFHGGYHAIPPEDAFYNLRTQMTLQVQDMGVPAKYHHHEVGKLGQCEIETPLMDLIKAGDATMIVKYVTKMVAYQNGKSATFMPKPLYREAGSGLHFHQQLLKENRNIFYSRDGYSLLSQTALHYIGGLLQHAPALLAFVSPSTNSYRRLVPGFEAPVNAFFSAGNRSAAVRIPKYATQPNEVRIEFRPPDSTCNIYLALAAQLMAGIDGIQRQIDPTESGFGPIEADIFSWTDEQREQIMPLPGSLREALDALAKDKDFLLSGGVFSEDLIERWITFKMNEEHNEVCNRPHPYEMELYFSV